MKTLLKLSLLSVLVALVSCGGGGGGGGTVYVPAPSTYGAYSSPSILASEFVNSLNSVDGTYSSSVQLYTNETLRSKVAGQDDWFVIWDAKFQEYKAVSLQYVRSIVYYDYYSNNKAVASEFRAIERADVIAGKLDGDYFGDDYEVVDRLASGYFEGRESGYLYDDAAESTDVSLQAREKAQKKFFAKAAKVSFVYNVSLETSMSLVTLGEKVEKMLARGSNNELTAEDQAALTTDMQALTGVSLAEVSKAAESDSAKADVLAKIADKLGTTSSNLEDKILPEVFGIKL